MCDTMCDKCNKLSNKKQGQIHENDKTLVARMSTAERKLTHARTYTHTECLNFNAKWTIIQMVEINKCFEIRRWFVICIQAFEYFSYSFFSLCSCLCSYIRSRSLYVKYTFSLDFHFVFRQQNKGVGRCRRHCGCFDIKW